MWMPGYSTGSGNLAKHLVKLHANIRQRQRRRESSSLHWATQKLRAQLKSHSGQRATQTTSSPVWENICVHIQVVFLHRFSCGGGTVKEWYHIWYLYCYKALQDIWRSRCISLPLSPFPPFCKKSLLSMRSLGFWSSNPTHSSAYRLDMYEWPLIPTALLQGSSQHLLKLC